uniref:Uncharacterized protein n=1 Tax=Dendroctonus ponderosae TaxID=77166 RepID=A0AAR5PRF2_DENPD
MSGPHQDQNSKAEVPKNEPIVEYVIEDSSDEDESSNLKVGLLPAALEAIKPKSARNKLENKPTICSLLIGDLSLNLKPQMYKGKMFGYTEGIGSLHQTKKLASKAVIFMVVSHNENWKIPIGIYFIHNPNIKHFADTIEEALTALDAIGVEIISITLNCISPHLNFALAEQLGAEIDPSKPIKYLKPYFIQTGTVNLIYILYDLDSILLFLKRFWAVERVLSYNGQVLGFSFCSRVKTIEETDFCVKKNQTDWRIIKKRLEYDIETIGKTLADAMEYLKDENHPEFTECGPVIKFIRVLDVIAQIARVNGSADGIIANISRSNEEVWKPLILNLIRYVKGLKHHTEDTPKHLSLFKIYTTGLIVYFTSLLKLYEKYVNYYDQRLPFLWPSKFALKHIALDIFTNKPDSALSVFKIVEAKSKKLIFSDF